MGRIEKTVFVSYRRTDESWGLAIFQDLTQHGYDVFIDYDGIASGNFETAILENIKARAHFLVLLTPTALDRCGDPKDWMRREIEAALDSQRNIVPLMLAGFDFGKPAVAGQLTGNLAALKEYNGLEIPKARFFSSEMERLRNKFLNVEVDAVLHPASDSAQQAATEQKDKATIALGDRTPAFLNREVKAEKWEEEQRRKREEASEAQRIEEQRLQIEAEEKRQAGEEQRRKVGTAAERQRAEKQRLRIEAEAKRRVEDEAHQKAAEQKRGRRDAQVEHHLLESEGKPPRPRPWPLSASVLLGGSLAGVVLLGAIGIWLGVLQTSVTPAPPTPVAATPPQVAPTQATATPTTPAMATPDTASLEEAVAAYRNALQEYTRERMPLDWARTQNSLGNALVRLGERETGSARLEEAVVAYRNALKEYTRERVPLDWAMTQRNLGDALVRLGERESGTARLEEAVAAYRNALQEYTRERMPLDWAMTQRILGTALVRLGERETGSARLEEAVVAYRNALKEYTRERVPLDWAMTQRNLGDALEMLKRKQVGVLD